MIFLIFNTVVVFKVHLGFALLEGGIVRIKNQQTTIFMCTADLCMNTIGWWLLGQSLSFGEHKPGYIVG
jgi:ammonia channel protein AmtB